MLLFCNQPPFLILSFSICKTLSPKHQHTSPSTYLQGYQECEKRGFQYSGGIVRKDAAEEYPWSQTGRVAHTVMYMAGDVETCATESRAFGKELVSSPAPQITHTYMHTPLCLAILVQTYLQSSSVTPHSLSPPPLNKGTQNMIKLKYTVGKCTQHPLPPPISFILKNIRAITTIMTDLLSATLQWS